MTLTELKAQAEKAKESDVELGFWREDISPDDVLRLVEVARLFKAWIVETSIPKRADIWVAILRLTEGIEP